VEVILIDDVDGLGKKGATVKVKNGYARNFWCRASWRSRAGTRRRRCTCRCREADATSRRTSRRRRREARREVRGATVEATARAGEDGTLFGSITSSDLAELLGKKGLGHRTARRSCRERDQDRSATTRSTSSSTRACRRRSPSAWSRRHDRRVLIRGLPYCRVRPFVAGGHDAAACDEEGGGTEAADPGQVLRARRQARRSRAATSRRGSTSSAQFKGQCRPRAEEGSSSTGCSRSACGSRRPSQAGVEKRPECRRSSRTTAATSLIRTYLSEAMGKAPAPSESLIAAYYASHQPEYMARSRSRSATSR
jgi:large subunit ribosomal protein L9